MKRILIPALLGLTALSIYNTVGLHIYQQRQAAALEYQLLVNTDPLRDLPVLVGDGKQERKPNQSTEVEITTDDHQTLLLTGTIERCRGTGYSYATMQEHIKPGMQFTLRACQGPENTVQLCTSDDLRNPTVPRYCGNYRRIG